MLLGLQLLCCLSACMGSDGMLVRFGSQAGVVRLDDGKQIVLRNGMRILALQLDTLQIGEGDCCLVDFQLNYDNQPDSLQNIWHADWLTYRPVDLNALGTLVPDDTMTTRADEHFLRFSIESARFLPSFTPNLRKYHRSASLLPRSLPHILSSRWVPREWVGSRGQK